MRKLISDLLVRFALWLTARGYMKLGVKVLNFNVKYVLRKEIKHHNWRLIEENGQVYMTCSCCGRKVRIEA